MSCVQSCQLVCAACKILFFKVCCQCLREKRISKSEFNTLALGLTNAGKSTLIAKLCNESVENVTATKGFCIKDIPLQSSILHVKEIGGSETVRQYWHNYFDGIDGMIYFVDGQSGQAETTLSLNELRKVVNHRSLSGVPLLILITKVCGNVQAIFEEVTAILSAREPSDSSSFLIEYCNIDQIDIARSALEKFSSLLEEQKAAYHDAELAARASSAKGSRL